MPNSTKKARQNLQKISPNPLSELSAGERIKQSRLKLGMSQSQFAKALGIKRRYTISDWERGKKTPKSYIWLAIDQLKDRAIP
jgi:DNA-binding transcriptional regulator YiaG